MAEKKEVPEIHHDVRRSRTNFTPYPGGDRTTALRPLRVRHVSPIRVPEVRRARVYTDSMICSQETAMEHLRYIRRQLEKDDREIKMLQQSLDQWNYPRKWTPYNYVEGHNEYRRDQYY